jgi:preprotein translocase subunit SecD
VEAAMQAFGGALPPDYEVLPYRDRDETSGNLMYMVVRRAPSLTGRNLKNARRSQDPYTGRSEVVFFMSPEGVDLFSRVTGQNVGNRLAIVLDGEIRSAPRIESRIATDSARITGSFTAQQADDLALVLRSGALPARITILENRVVGPSLGMDSIRSGILACMVGLGLVLLGMIVVYRWSGVNAIFCLLMNVLMIGGALGYFRATLTLPGIAGVILTIGMAVDANILIFERVKEELRVGKTVRSALDAGFKRVFTTILDTNLTTLIAALFLFQFGTGPIRGFAVTLAVGLIANVFAATFVSRALFDTFLQKREVTKLSI